MLLESKKIGLMPLHRLNCVYLYYIIYYNDNPDYGFVHEIRAPHWNLFADARETERSAATGRTCLDDDD